LDGIALLQGVREQILHRLITDPVRARTAFGRLTSNAYDPVIEGESCRRRSKPTLGAAIRK
jgi:hypothetical protein